MPELAPSTFAILARYWATSLGCAVASLQRTGTTCVPLAPDDEYWGVFFFQHQNALVITVPLPLYDTLSPSLALLQADDVARVERLRNAIGSLAGRVIGPAYLGYADAHTLTPVSSTGVRLLTSADAPALARLRGACSAEAWEHGGLGSDAPLLAGRFVDGELVTLGGYEIWGGALAHIYIVTHPAYRGRGLGRSVVSAVAVEALRRKLVPQYRTLERNTASVAIASSLGFERYATTVAVRLLPPN